MTDWLSFWNKQTRAENEPRLARHGVARIYIPHGAGRIAVHDRIYCVGIEGGDLLLITRIDATSVKPDEDPKHIDSLLVDGADNGIVAAYDRTVPDPDLEAIRYFRVKGTKPEPIKLTSAGDVIFSAFQGRSSIRELVEGTGDLDALLNPVVIPLYGPRELKFDRHPRIESHLGLLVVEPGGLLPTIPEQPVRPTTEQPPAMPRPAYPEPDEEDLEIHYFYEGDLGKASVFKLEPVSFRPIEHQGLIYVIEATDFVPRETFEIAIESAKRRNITSLPIYVRATRRQFNP